jgi:hypothetical protein
VTIGKNQPATRLNALNPALTINAALTIADGATLTLRGNVTQHKPGVKVTGEGAGRIVFDSTRADPPSTSWIWSMGAYGSTEARRPMLVIRGTPTRRFRIESAPGGGHGYFDNGPFASTASCACDLEHADIVRIGDRDHPAFAPSGQAVGIFRGLDCRFISCGEVTPGFRVRDRDVIRHGAFTFDLVSCQFISPAGDYAIRAIARGGVARGGTWRVEGCDVGGPILVSDQFDLVNNRYRTAWYTKRGSRGPLPQPASPSPHPVPYTLAGPSDLLRGTAASYTLELSGGMTDPLTIRLGDGGKGGTFMPSTVTLAPAKPSAVVSYMPKSLGSVAIASANDRELFDPTPIAATVTAPADRYVLTAPADRTFSGYASNPFTVALEPYRTLATPVTITPTDGGAGGAFTPATITLSNTQRSAIYTYKPGYTEAVTLTGTNDGRLNDPAVSVTVLAPRNTSSVIGPAAVHAGYPSLSFTVTPGMPSTGTLTPSDGAGGTFTPASLTWANTAEPKSFAYTSKGTGARSIAFTSSGSMVAPPPLGVEARESMTYYVTNRPGSGMGTLADPFGMADLPADRTHTSRALDLLAPGDTLYFRGGAYHFTLFGDHVAWIAPHRSGTAEQPITIASYPGEVAELIKDGGDDYVSMTGTVSPKGTVNHAIIKGFVIRPGLWMGVQVHGNGHEIAYNKLVGSYAQWKAIDNYDALETLNASDVWIHHNEVCEFRDALTRVGGIKLYWHCDNITVEDNYVHDCDGLAITNKGHATNSTIRRNLVMSNARGIAGAMYADGAVKIATHIHDNVTDYFINNGNQGDRNQIHNNLILSASSPRVVYSSTGDRRTNGWDNIVITPTSSVTYPHSIAYTPSGASAPIEYLDYNLYVAADGSIPAPTYTFTGKTYTLAEFRAEGFERHSQAIAGGPAAIFAVPKTFALKPKFLAAGRDGGMPGPADVATILDVSRYGPVARP